MSLTLCGFLFDIADLLLIIDAPPRHYPKTVPQSGKDVVSQEYSTCIRTRLLFEPKLLLKKHLTDIRLLFKPQPLFEPGLYLNRYNIPLLLSLYCLMQMHSKKVELLKYV